MITILLIILKMAGIAHFSWCWAFLSASVDFLMAAIAIALVKANK